MFQYINDYKTLADLYNFVHCIGFISVLVIIDLILEQS